MKTIDWRTKLMLREPRSITRETAPVCRFRWKRRSRLRRCSKMSRATRRIARCATDANTAFRSSFIPAAVLRASPSANHGKKFTAAKKDGSGSGLRRKDGEEGWARAVGRTSEEEGDREDEGHLGRVGHVDVQLVHDVLEDEWDLDVEHLAAKEEAHRKHNSRLERRLARRPDVVRHRPAGFKIEDHHP